MRRRAMFVLISVLLVLLLLSVFAQVRVLPTAIAKVIAVFPEVKPLSVPSVIWGVFAIACWQAVGLIGVRLAILARDYRLDASAYKWLRAMIGCLLGFIVLVGSACVALSVMGYTTPGVMYGLIGGGLLALIGVVSLAMFLATRPVVHFRRIGPAALPCVD